MELGSLRSLAQASGDSKSTIHRLVRHVALGTRYRELQAPGLSRYKVLLLGRLLDGAALAEQSAWRRILRVGLQPTAGEDGTALRALMKLARGRGDRLTYEESVLLVKAWRKSANALRLKPSALLE
jgi:hypothetical protein